MSFTKAACPDVGQAAIKKTFRPNAPINRAEVAKMIMLALKLQ